MTEDPVRLEPVERLQLQFDIDQLNAAYAAALDEKRFEAWPEFFVENGRYTVQARENFDRGLPLALMDLESRGMMKDRVYGITQTIYHGPYYTRHVVSPAQVLALEGEIVTAQANYAVFRTKPAGVSEVYNVGRYVDKLVRTAEGLRFKSRLCVYDSEMILNSLIYPV
ncbi:MAG: aromatic-ring-hydroxylating dioxygenase subunit beta [Polaromonas sp.]|nr:aromatic-ring-hydroxylating dioxygenase subunit beta [Polaromonas sp.]